MAATPSTCKIGAQNAKLEQTIVGIFTKSRASPPGAVGYNNATRLVLLQEPGLKIYSYNPTKHGLSYQNVCGTFLFRF